MHSYQHSLLNFFITGISYKKSDASLRGHFAVNTDQYNHILEQAASYGIHEILILSTCNRTEIYGFASSSEDLAKLLTTQTSGTFDTFQQLSYSRQGVGAIEHLYNVAAGLDSQILGDYEIVGQIKQAAKISKNAGFLGAYMERMINEVLAASKKIRTTTALSGGTVSVSFAAIQYIRSFTETKTKKILLIGTGKFGGNTCKNIRDYLPGHELVLMNRTTEKAKLLAETFNVRYDRFENLEANLKEADIILVATSAVEPVILKDHFSSTDKKLVIDLSVPCNVENSVNDLHGITLVNVDELSRIKDETLQKRALEVPKVKFIIAAHISAFVDWHQMRQHVPVLKAVKSKLLTIQSDRIFDDTVCASVALVTNKAAEERIQKVINGMAVKMKIKNQRGCNYIEAINDFISPTYN